MTPGTNAPPQTIGREARAETAGPETLRRTLGRTLGRSIALIGLILLSLLTGAAALTLLRGWTSIAALSLAVAVWRPRWAIALLLALLPIFGNKPGMRQVYALVLLGSCLNIGVALRGLVSWPRPQRPAFTRNPLFVLLVLYGVASTLSLSTLPLTEIWLDSLRALGGSPNPVAHLALWLKATETDAAYSIVSVILTWYAIALAFFIRREIACDAAVAAAANGDADADAAARLLAERKIGRASCRERV